LFFLARANGKQSAIPQGAIMIVLIVITVGFQLTLNSGYKPLVQYLPLSVAHKMADNASSNDDGRKNSTAVGETPREKDQSSASPAPFLSFSSFPY
jgi:hypothetical protein